MISLRNFVKADIPALRETQYGDMPESEFLIMANTRTHHGAYFEIFAICRSEEIVGSLSFFQLGEGIISLGPEIFPAFRRQGLAFAAMAEAMDRARAMGYHTFEAQVRQDNRASIRLHEKLGFSRRRAYVNRKGNPVYLYQAK